MTITLRMEAARYPARLRERLGTEAPAAFLARGATDLLRRPAVAVFCSRTPPPELVLPALDAARELAGAGATVAGGFQSPVERMVLDALLDARARVIALLARAPAERGLPTAWQAALREERLLLLATGTGRRRLDAALAQRRNRTVAALATELLVVHAAPGGSVQRLAEESLAWGIPLRVLEHPANEPLLLLGGTPWRGGGSGPQRPHPVEGDEKAGAHVGGHRHPEGGVA